MTDPASPGFRVQRQADAVSFDVVVVPRASRSRIVGLSAGRLKITLAAAPVDGEANQALCELLAKQLSVPKRAVQVQRGERSKLKTVQVTGLTVEDVLNRLPLTLADKS
jgi:uncharacterized protein (TIGR00251 family)